MTAHDLAVVTAGLTTPSATRLLADRLTEAVSRHVPVEPHIVELREHARDIADLVKLPGVGRKTANVVLGNAFDVPGITVDTHFGRLVRRFGWTDEKDPVKVEHEVGSLFPRKDWTMLSHRVIWHGLRVCHARRPACGACVLAPLCPSFGEGPTDEATATGLLKMRSFA